MEDWEGRPLHSAVLDCSLLNNFPHSENSGEFLLSAVCDWFCLEIVAIYFPENVSPSSAQHLKLSIQRCCVSALRLDVNQTVQVEMWPLFLGLLNPFPCILSFHSACSSCYTLCCQLLEKLPIQSLMSVSIVFIKLYLILWFNKVNHGIRIE